MVNGTVKFFNNSKGFGFLTSEDGNDYFVHITDVKDGLELKDDLKVVFEVVEGDRGPKATNVYLMKRD